MTTPINTIDDFYFFTRTGTVIDRQVESDTQIYGSVTNGHGRISSSTTDYLTLFLREADGDEFSAVLQDFPVQARVGNRVSIIFAGTKVTQTGRPAGFVNHDTHREAIRDEAIQSLAPVSKSGCALLMVVPILAFLMLGTIARTALGLLGDDSLIAIALLLGWLLSPLVAFVVMLKRGRRQTRQANDLQSQIRAAVQQQIEAARSNPPPAPTAKY